jgi:hypothetical protein
MTGTFSDWWLLSVFRLFDRLKVVCGQCGGVLRPLISLIKTA